MGRERGWVRYQAPTIVVAGNRSKVREEIEASAGEQVAVVEVDMSSTTYVDSSGLGALARALKNCKAKGTEVVVSNLNSDLWTLFQLTKLNSYFFIRAQDDSEDSDDGDEESKMSSPDSDSGHRTLKLV